MANVRLIAAPTPRRTSSMSPAPKAWPMRTVAAMPNPNTSAKIRNMTMLALAVAARASLPIKRPTHTALIEALIVCSILPTSWGRANSSSVLTNGPFVRSPRRECGGLSDLRGCRRDVLIALFCRQVQKYATCPPQLGVIARHMPMAGQGGCRKRGSGTYGTLSWGILGYFDLSHSFQRCSVVSTSMRPTVNGRSRPCLPVNTPGMVRAGW